MYSLLFKLNSFCHKTLDRFLSNLSIELKSNKDIKNIKFSFLPVKIQKIAYIRSFFAKKYSGEHIETRIYSRYVTITCQPEFNIEIIIILCYHTQ